MTTPLPVDQDHLVLLSKNRREILVYQRIRSFPAAIGRNPGDKRRVGDNRTPETPAGRTYTVTGKLHTSPTSPFGSRYLGLDSPPWRGIAIHGTNEPDTVGTMASHGCARLFNADAEWLYNAVQLGDPVLITP
ncbi:MAG: L,D-transpeptidase [Chloroflexota bacterium]